ncbi:hypothetical protein LDDCCGHA_5837 [Methylobacterium oxalidis]|nr:hypothetical protein LDDCCGHA_5837 [Methylobacterium oxalidis]
MVPTRLHALADYLLPAVIVAQSLSPHRGRATRRIMQAGPVWHYSYTLLTRYEGGSHPPSACGPILPAMRLVPSPSWELPLSCRTNLCGTVCFSQPSA